MMKEREEGDKLTSEGIIIDGIFQGLPYEGPVLNLKTDDPAHMQPKLVATVSINTFMMDNPDDVKKYIEQMEDIGRGWSEISVEDVQWIPAKETWKIFLRMMHKKYIAPEDTSRVQES